GTLVIRGSYAKGFAFEHADGVPYGTTSRRPPRPAAHAANGHAASGPAANGAANDHATSGAADMSSATDAATGPTAYPVSGAATEQPGRASVASPARALAFAKSLEILVALGFKQSQAQAMLDGAKTHVGREPTVDDVVRAALRHAAVESPRPPGASMVRESAAVYERL